MASFSSCLDYASKTLDFELSIKEHSIFLYISNGLICLKKQINFDNPVVKYASKKLGITFEDCILKLKLISDTFKNISYVDSFYKTIRKENRRKVLGIIFI